jgi:hypothetical protein
MTASGQLSRPPPGSYLAVSGQFPVAAVRQHPGVTRLLGTQGHHHSRGRVGAGVSGYDPDTDDTDQGRDADVVGEETAPGEGATVGEEDLEPLFPTVQDWVHGFLAPTIVRRSSQDFLWCPRWWAHAEVVSRLTGLWITWEQARTGDPADINTWWLQHLDPHLAAITTQGGPLDGCSQHDGHSGTRPGLQVEDPPPGTLEPF